MAIELMDRESWIASRTDNPDRLGKALWENMYDVCFALATESDVSRVPANIPPNIRKEMYKEFVLKQGLSCDLTNSDQLEVLKIFFRLLNSGDEYQSKSSIQKLLDFVKKNKTALGLENAAKSEATNGKNDVKKTLASGVSRENGIMTKNGDVCSK